MVKIEGMSFAYKKEFPIFLNFHWNIIPGERWSIIGPSGCGKTTLLYLLAGLRFPSSGEVIVSNGHSNGNKHLTGLILQDFGLLPWATAYENIYLGLKIQRVEKEDAAQITKKWLAKLGIEAVCDHYPAELSGGQRQRVAIARTLAMEPSLLLMDEPFASLDSMTREELLELAMSLWKNLTSTMLLVTHNIDEAVRWGSKILVLGHAPNTDPFIIENSLSDSVGYPNSPEFLTRCQQIRSMMVLAAGKGKMGENA